MTIEWAVFDIDGVVADVRHRLHFVESKPKSWPKFFGAAVHDTPLEVGVALAREYLDSGHRLAWLTGRPEHLRRVTTSWLSDLDLPTDTLLMRRGNDFRPARIYKPEQLGKLADRGTVTIVVDDDPKAVAAMEAAGYPVRLADWVPRDDVLDVIQEEGGRS